MVNPLKKRNAPASRVERHLEEAVAWIEHNQETFWGVIGAVILVGAFLGFVVHQRSVTNIDAWQKLGAVQSQGMQGHLDQESKSLSDWESHFAGSSAASYEKFLKADLLYKTSDYAAASQIYAELSQTASPAIMRPLALSGQVSSEEMAGHLPQALALAQHFTDQYPDHFLAGSIYLTQARLDEETGNKTAAAALYDRIALLYPQSPWTAIAHTRSQVLAPGSAASASAAHTASVPGLAAPAHP